MGVELGKTHHLEVGENNKKVDYIRLCPPVEKLTSREPVVFLLGFSEDPKTHEKLLKAVYDEGYIVFCLKTYPRQTLSTKENGHPPGLAQNIGVASALIHEARSFDPDNPDEKTDPQGKVNLMGRSMGGVIGAFTASQEPENIHNLFLIDTKLTPPEHPLNLAFNFTISGTKAFEQTIFHPLQNKHVPRVAEKLATYILSHPKMTIDEISAIANADMRPLLPKLRQQGIGVHGIHGTSDQVFPIDNISIDQACFDSFFTVGPKKNTDTPSPKELGYTPDYTPINHGSIHSNDKYITLITYALKNAIKPRSS